MSGGDDMANKRDLSLTPRIENQREAQPIIPPVQFSLIEIKQHFIDSMNSVKAQYAVADALLGDDNAEGSSRWRASTRIWF